MNQLSSHRRQSIVLTFGVAVFDRHVLARDITGFTEALPKCGHEVRSAGGRAVQKPDHGIADRCCARSGSGQEAEDAAAAPPSSVMNWRRLTPSMVGAPAMQRVEE